MLIQDTPFVCDLGVKSTTEMQRLPTDHILKLHKPADMRPAQFNALGFSPGFLQVVDFPECSTNIIVSSTRKKLNFLSSLREAVKYYFADFVRKGGGGTPKIRNPLFAEKRGTLTT